ncbi:MAG: Gfo/Idh/MocA family oxidoreductase [Planctomycetaceae bacterium]|jgi:predicted dehydrogenase|nr:Gfo/Idh/MocA family oxidoreductase [Planctomycetaceae bacterium]
MKHTRRSFLKNSMSAVALASTFAISGTKASGRILGANDRIRIGVAGIRSRGIEHIKSFGAIPNVEVAALVDVDKTFFDPRVEEVKKKFGNTPECFQDIREVLDNKNIDAISLATCDHTHSLYTVWACQAGKDVYVEKPCSQNVVEGRRCVEAAEKYKRIVQHGTQLRAAIDENCRFLNPSLVPYQQILAALKSGKYGKLKLVKGYCCRNRWTIGYKQPEQPPETLAWDAWLGPAPEQPFHKNLVHYEWHWFWDFGCGDIGNLGIHELDVCRWMTERKLPKTVLSFGQRYVNEPQHRFKDQGQTPNLMLTLFDYGDVQILFETRGLIQKKSAWVWKVDVEIFTDQGTINQGVFSPYNDPQNKVKIETDYEKPEADVFRNFIDCMRSRQRNKLAADILEGHYTSALVHTANISYRLGEMTSIDTIRSTFGNEPAVQQSINDIVKNTGDMLPELKNPQFTLGQKLTFSDVTETFENNAAANSLLTRKYRSPYIVPENV